MNDREKFLIEMYGQMFNDINRHILVVWQSMGVLVGAFAVFALVEKKVVSLDLASSIILILSSWLVAHLFDAAYWYNRNSVIISNIERQFLVESDLKDICYYFGSHRPSNKMIQHLRIQLFFGVMLGGVVLLYHFIERVLPGFSSPLSSIDPVRALPYIILVVAFFYLRSLKASAEDKYQEFLSNSPGVKVVTDGINYGKGHGHE